MTAVDGRRTAPPPTHNARREGALMGVLIDGVWQAEQRTASATDGRFVRADTQFRNWITATGEPGPSGRK